MGSPLVIALAITVTAFIAAAAVVLSRLLRDKRQAEREDSVAKAALEYLSRFEIRARIVAVTLPGNRVVLMVETPPHKKLRFSYIIEQPIKQFVLKQTQVEVDRMFWRFPMPPKGAQAPEVQYGSPTTQAPPTPQAAASQAPAPDGKAAPAKHVDEDDEYFLHHSYQIEEVSWEDFSTISKPDASPADAEK